MSVSSERIIGQQPAPVAVRLRTEPAGRVHVCVCGAPMVGGDHPRWTDCADREDARNRVALAQYEYAKAQHKEDVLRAVRYARPEDEEAAQNAAYDRLRDLMAARVNERAVERKHTSWRRAA